jgi:hypothetical protein
MSSTLIDVLAEAAARGVQVTIITNADRDPPPLTLKWRFWTTNDSGWGEFRGGGYLLKVRDCDGDFSAWYVCRGDPQLKASRIADGETHGYDPYHFDAALLAAEAAFREERAQAYRCTSAR